VASTNAGLTVFFDERTLAHDTGTGMWEASPSDLLCEQELHPENSIRIRNMKSVLERGPVASEILWSGGRLAEVSELLAVHDADYVKAVRALCDSGGGRLTGTTVVSAKSWEPLLAAAGTSLAAADAVLEGSTRLALALVRPPGHHAQRSQADGFCVFSHAALVAQRARESGLQRVAVIDWDVHHGNGTQECFYDRSDVLTVSIHMAHGAWGASHPQTGSPDETGVGRGEGFNVNVELPLGAGDRAYSRALSAVVSPVLEKFQPELLVSACGQDASAFDPEGRHNVTMAGFHGIGRQFAELADRHSGGRAVLVQEGGYARSYAAYCLHATVEGLLGRAPELADPLAYVPDDPRRGEDAIRRAAVALEPAWGPLA
jgi:acetoin utilization deacetylase AcuC-like enzyme